MIPVMLVYTGRTGCSVFQEKWSCFSPLYSATVNNLQAKVDALEKSNTKLTEEVSVLEIL